MALQATPGAKKFLRLLAVLLIVGGGIYFAKSKGLLDRIFKKSVVVTGVDLPDAPKTSTGDNVPFSGIPSTSVSSKSPQYGTVTMNMMTWNAQQPLIYANGGPTTTEGSLMEREGVKLIIKRQDDDMQSVQEMIKFGKAYHDNPASAEGVAIFQDMGDGAPSILQAMNSELSKLDDGKCDYCAVIVGATGFSNGEDALLGPVSWRENPQNARGSVISTVLRNGDYNIPLIFGQNNQIKINNDEHTYDPDAINFINAPDFVKAGEIYISGQKETRPVVKDGKKTGETKEIQATAVSSWFPVDLNIAQNKGGLVRILSTHDNQAQMPAVIFVIKKYAQDHKDQIEGILKAATDGGDQLKSYQAALDAAGEISAKVYNEKDGEFWTKAAKGYVLSDKQGLQVDIGGSGFYNLADNLLLFNTNGGSYPVVYNTFSKKYLEYFPELYKSFPKYEDIVDLTYLNDLQSSKDISKTSASTTTFSKSAISQVVAKRSWNIQFALGSAVLTPDGQATVEEIYNALIISNNLKVELDGHTDNNGSDQVNIPLSEARANAVKTYLQNKSLSAFPDNRFTVHGFGGSQPIADNSTKAGQQLNRRVSVIMGH